MGFVKRYFWRLVTVCLLCALVPVSAYAQDETSQADSLQLRSDNFTLSGKMDGAQGVEMISELERFRAALLEIHDLPADSKDQRVDIYIISDSEIFDIMGVNENFVAIYSQTHAGPRALINGSAKVFDIGAGSTLRHGLRHEYAHHFTKTYLRLPETLWMAEGLAEYYAGYIENEDGSYHFGASHAPHEYVLSFPILQWRDIRDVLSSLGGIKTVGIPLEEALRSGKPDNTSYFYAQSWALTHWILNGAGAPPAEGADPQTTLRTGLKKLTALSEYLIVNSMPASRDLSHWPEMSAARLESGGLDAAIAQFSQSNFGLPLMVGQTTSKKTDTLESRIAAYIEDGVPVLPSRPGPDRVTSSVTVTTLSPTQAAAIQYRHLSLTAGMRAFGHPRMMRLKADIEADPETALSLMMSDAAQSLSISDVETAVKLLEKAAAQGGLTPEDERLSLAIAFHDFADGAYLNPEAMREKLRPALARAPEDVSLLVMMAVTGTGDLRATLKGEEAVISSEARSALQTLETMEATKTRPRQTLPLVNLYAIQENYKAALELLYRTLAFEPSTEFELKNVAYQLEALMIADP